MRTILSILAALSLTGCASMSDKERTAYLDAQTALASQPTLEIDCPQGCSVAYTDPRDRQIQPPDVTNGWDFANAVLGTATTLAPWYGVTRLGVEAIGALEDRQDRTSITRTNTRGDTAGGDLVGGDQRGDVRGDVRGDTRGDVRDVIGGDRTDRTSEPTVVEQPEPVTQPQPVVVQ